MTNDNFVDFKPRPLFKDYKEMLAYSNRGRKGRLSPVRYVVFDADGTIWRVSPMGVVAGQTFVKLQEPDVAIIQGDAMNVKTGKTFMGLKSTVTLRPHFRGLLTKLDKWAISYSLVTFSNFGIIKPLVSALKLADRFDGIYTEMDRFTVLESIANYYQIPHGELLLVDDDTASSHFRFDGFQVLIWGVDVTNMWHVEGYIEKRRGA